MDVPAISVVVPAFNEARVIHRSVGPLVSLVEQGKIQLIVAANGCTDETVEIVEELCPMVEVIEISDAGKTKALNHGVTKCKAKAVVFLDADLQLAPEALMKLVDPILNGDAEATCGRMIARSEESSWLVRAFYKGWALNPYFDNGKFGGVFALSGHLVNKVFPLPEVTSDDEFISRLAMTEAFAYQPDAVFEVQVPRRLSDLVRIRRRSRRGTAALETAGLRTERPTNASVLPIMLRRVALRPTRAVDVMIYLAVSACVRLGLLVQSDSSAQQWERDESSRESLPSTSAHQLRTEPT